MKLFVEGHKQFVYDFLCDVSQCVDIDTLKKDHFDPIIYFEGRLCPTYFPARSDLYCGDMPVSIDRVLSDNREGVVKRIVVLHGLGGMGKTEACLQYVGQVQETNKYPGGIFFISANSENNIVQGMRDIAPWGSVTGNMDFLSVKLIIKGVLERAKCNFLFVFDNADDVEVVKFIKKEFDEKFLGHLGHAIITTRLSAGILYMYYIY